MSEDLKGAPKPVMMRVIDDPVRGIETKIVVFDMALGLNILGQKVVEDYTAQLYRRVGGAGEWKVVHTCDSATDELVAYARARKWHQANPTKLELS